MTATRRPSGRSFWRANLRGSTWRVLSFVLQWVLCLALVYVIWVYLLLPRTSRVVIVPPSQVWQALTDLWDNGFSNQSFWAVIWTTLREGLIGFGLGVAVGVLLAVLIGASPPLVGKLIEPVVIAVYASPKYVIVPVMFLWLGNGLMTKVYFVMLAVLPVVAIYTLTGIRTVDPDIRQMMLLLGASRGQIGRKLLLPHALGYLLTAVAYTIPLTISMALGAEILMGATDGLGGMLNTASFNFNGPQVYAALTLATVLSVILIASAQLLSTRLYGVRGMSGRR